MPKHNVNKPERIGTLKKKGRSPKKALRSKAYLHGGVTPSGGTEWVCQVPGEDTVHIVQQGDPLPPGCKRIGIFSRTGVGRRGGASSKKTGHGAGAERWVRWSGVKTVLAVVEGPATFDVPSSGRIRAARDAGGAQKHTSGPNDDPLSEAFRTRYRALVDRVAETAPATILGEALGNPDDIAGMATALHYAAVGTPVRTHDPLAAAKARAVQVKRDLVQQAGGTLRVSEVSAMLGLTRQAIHNRRGNDTLLAVQTPTHEWVYPRCQFVGSEVLPGLPEVLRALPVQDPWMRLNVLLARDPMLGNRSPLDALRDGETEAAVKAVRAFGEQGA